MKSMKKTFLKSIARSAYETAKREADSACFCYFFQPVMPEKVKKLRKKK